MAILAGSVSSAAEPERYEATREELEALQSELDSVQQTIRQRRDARDSVQEEVARLDREAGEARRELRRLEQQVDSHREEIAEIEAAYQEEAERVRAQRDALAREMRSAWIAGERTGLRIALEGRDPAELQRLLVYHEVYREERTRRVSALLEELSELAALREERDQRVESLEAAQARLRTERESLQARLEKREQERRELESRIAEAEDEAERLRGDVAEQEQLLEELRDQLADVPDTRGEAFDSFEAARGRLPWPAEGTVDGRFGERRSGDLRRTGIAISTEPETEVHAVAPGRVVFSDWLRGLGLLVIIDHGEGYLTLYGHAHALYAEVGDWVQRGDTVAVAGTSGARTRPGVHFEIRAGEEPQDPGEWLR